MTQNLSDRVSVKTAAMQGPFYASNNSNTGSDATGANTVYGPLQNTLNTLAEGTYKIVPQRSIALQDQLALVGFSQSMRVDLEKRYPRKKLPNGEWQTYTPTITNGPAMASNSARWRRVGSAIEIQAVMSPSADGTSTLDFIVGLPSGLTAVTTGDIAVGSGFGLEEAGSADVQNQIIPVMAGTDSIRFYGKDPGGTGSTTLNGDDIGTSTGYIRYLTFFASIEVSEYAADSENYGITFEPQSDGTVNVEVGAKADENTDWSDLTGINWALEHKGPTTYSAIDGEFDTVSADIIEGKSGDGPAIKGRTDGAPGAGEIGEAKTDTLTSNSTFTALDSYTNTALSVTLSKGWWFLVATGSGSLGLPDTGGVSLSVSLYDGSSTLAESILLGRSSNPSIESDNLTPCFAIAHPVYVSSSTTITVQAKQSTLSGSPTSVTTGLLRTGSQLVAARIA